MSQLPVGWEVKQLGYVCENLDSRRTPISKAKRASGDIPYYGASGVVDYVAGYIFDEDLLLVSEDGANLLARTYPIAFSISGKSWVNNHAHVLRFKASQSQRFIEYYLNSISLEPHVSGMAQPKLNQKALNSISVPFPPLPEQKRIVTILDEAFAGITQAAAHAEKNLANARELFESYFNAVCTRKGEGWVEKKLGEECEILMGQSPPGSSYNSDGIGVPLINGPVEFGGIDPFSKTVATKFTTEPKKMCKVGDLILCVRGSTTGRMNIAGQDACIGRGVAAIRSETNQGWVNLFIGFNKDAIYALGSGATFPNVSSADLRRIIVPLPPKHQRSIIVARIEELNSETQRLEAIYQQKLTALTELKQSILQKAFTGELTVEPAELKALA